MKLQRYLLIACAVLTGASGVTAGFFTPHLSLSAEGGATESFLETDSQMTRFFEPTSGVEKAISPAISIAIDLSLGNYLGITSGLGYQRYGQSTTKTTVLLKNDIFEHDFESHFYFDYLTVPLIIKAGIRKPRFSLFLRGGLLPSILVKEDIAWIFDGNAAERGSSRMPAVETKTWSAPLHLGAEAGYHFGKNSVFLIGHYNHGWNNIAYGIPGNVFLRSYGATLQYRRLLF